MFKVPFLYMGLLIICTIHKYKNMIIVYGVYTSILQSIDIQHRNQEPLCTHKNLVAPFREFPLVRTMLQERYKLWDIVYQFTLRRYTWA